MKNSQSRMLKKMGLGLLVGLLALTLTASLAWSFASSPPNARTNAPGEGNCTACHSTFPLNSGSGTLSVSGLDGSYDAGQSYDLVVSLQDPAASRWGFEFTVIGENGQQIGSLTNLGAQTQISSTSNRSYAKQTSVGTQNGTSGGVTWTVRWTAPAAGAGNASIYLVGNAANGNFSTSGDHIYAISQVWTENDLSPAPLPVLAAAELKPNFPNPFNPRTTLAYELPAAQSVRLAIYSLDGRLVRNLVDGLRGEGRHEVMWDGLDQQGSAVSSGTYFYTLRTLDGVQTRSMVLVR